MLVDAITPAAGFPTSVGSFTVSKDTSGNVRLLLSDGEHVMSKAQAVELASTLFRAIDAINLSGREV